MIQTRSEATGKSIDEIEKDFMSDIPLKRIGAPKEFGAAVAFMCPPSAGYINGTNLPVDGGKLQTL